jgi:outer membrane protein assembly factor BamB
MKHYIVACILLLSTSMAMAQYKGKVFVDTNRNGVFDKGESAMSGVSVSDGLNVTQTNSQGMYSLPGYAKERFIFITTPSGYKTNNAYYKRIVKGTSEYDFPIYAYDGGIKKDGTHKFIQISDTEIRETQGHDDWVGNIRDYVANEGVAFVIQTGDICYPSGLKSHIQLMNTSNMINTQMFYCLGNHDLVKGRYGEELFETLYGPVWYSFDVGNIHYIVTPMPSGDYQPSFRKEDVYHWLKNDLKYVAKNKSIIIFNHSVPNDSPNAYETFKMGISSTDSLDLVAHHLKAWFYGHWHVNHIQKSKVNDVYTICTATPIRGGIDHASSAFRVLTVMPNGRFTSELRYSYFDKSLRIASIDNMQSPVLSSGNVPISVNAYSTISPVVAMKYSCLCDGRMLLSDRPLKQLTDFNWYGEMSVPSSFNHRLLTVAVEARFKNGEIAKTERSFFYTSNKQNKIQVGESTNLLGNTQHIGIVKDSLSLPLRLAWVKNVGSNIYMSSPLLYHQSVIVASADDNESGKATVTSFNAANGALNWRCHMPASIRNSIAITSGIVFAQDVHGVLYAIRTNDGTIAWQKDLEVGLTPPIDDGLIATDGIVYAGTGQSLCALKATSGELIWKNNGWNRGEGCTATLSLNNDVLIGHANWRSLYGNDAKTGKMLWSQEGGGLRFRSASAAMKGDSLYLISNLSFFIIESKTGRILVQKELGYNVDVTSTPLVTDKEIIFGTAEKGVVALDRQTLKEKWNFMTKPALIYSSPYVRNPACTVETSPVLAGNVVYIGASDGFIYALDKTNGTLLWKHDTGAPVFATVTISGNALFAADFSGNVYCFASDDNQ